MIINEGDPGTNLVRPKYGPDGPRLFSI